MSKKKNYKPTGIKVKWKTTTKKGKNAYMQIYMKRKRASDQKKKRK